jgi:hypothetical protein
MAEEANEKTERQDNPGSIPQGDMMGHCSSGKDSASIVRAG